MRNPEIKTLLIIGSSGGIGTELIRYFEAKNYILALHYYKHPPVFTKATTRIYQADITNEDEVISLISQVKTDLGQVDCVVHNAGISRNGMSWKTAQAEWDATLAVNLTGPFLVSKHCIPLMREAAFGRLIFMSSIVAQTGFIGTAAYAASKAGLIGLAKTLAKEVAGKNITSNAIALGYFNTGMIQDVPPEMQEQLKASIPTGVLGDPAQLAALIDYLCSDNAAYLTGQTLNLNGGLYS